MLLFKNSEVFFSFFVVLLNDTTVAFVSVHKFFLQCND